MRAATLVFAIPESDQAKMYLFDQILLTCDKIFERAFDF